MKKLCLLVLIWLVLAVPGLFAGGEKEAQPAAEPAAESAPAAVEVKGYVARDAGQYTDFPISSATSEEMAMAAELMEGYVEADNKKAFVDGLVDGYDLGEYDLNETLGQMDSEYGFDDDKKEYLEQIPQNLKKGEYVVPAPNGAGWEVVDERRLKSILTEEAITMLDNMMGGNEYFMMRDNEELQYFPQSKAFNSYFKSFDDYLKESDRFLDLYGVDYGTVTLYLHEGDFLSGCVVPCSVYNITFDQYIDDVLVTINLLFSVNTNNRTVELKHNIINILRNVEDYGEEIKKKEQF